MSRMHRAVARAPMAPKMITVIRIDPDRKSVAKILFRCGKNAVAEVRRVLRAKTVGHFELTQIEAKDGTQTPLMVAGGLDLSDGIKGFRFRCGSESTAGIAILFGRGPGGGMVSCPADLEWVNRQIVWLDKEPIGTEPN